ncbi:unnamed protein product [Discosporangium mesarthrocarpum]
MGCQQSHGAVVSESVPLPLDRSSTDINEDAAYSPRDPWLEIPFDRTGVSRFPTDVNMSDLDIEEHIANGAFCAVYAARYGRLRVAVKVPMNSCPYPGEAIAGVLNEKEVLKRIDHVHLISCYGAGMNCKTPFLVLEMLHRETLADMCGTAAPREDSVYARVQRKSVRTRLPFVRRLHLAKELASALQYLHEEAIPGGVIIHRDLKPKNIGISRHGEHIKLFDLGLAKVLDENQKLECGNYKLTGETGSQRYMAPEVFLKEPYNEKADIYSLGLIIWELLTLKQPYMELSTVEHIGKVVNGGQRPHLDKRWPTGLHLLLRESWKAEANQRSKASTLVSQLEHMEQTIDKSSVRNL